jgi:hypothetical protein
MSGRKLSAVSSEEMDSAHSLLRGLFNEYGQAGGITCDGCLKFATSCGLVDSKCVLPAEII